MLALVGHDGRHFRVVLRLVELLLVTLERLHEVGDGARTEDRGQGEDEADAASRRARRRHVSPCRRESSRPDLGVPPLVGGDGTEGSRPPRILLDARQPVIEHDGIALELEVGKASLEVGRVEGGDAAHLGIVAEDPARRRIEPQCRGGAARSAADACRRDRRPGSHLTDARRRVRASPCTIVLRSRCAGASAARICGRGA